MGVAQSDMSAPPNDSFEGVQPTKQENVQTQHHNQPTAPGQHQHGNWSATAATFGLLPPNVWALIARWLRLQDRLTLARLVLLAPGIDGGSISSDSEHHAARAAAAAAVLEGVRAVSVTLGPAAGPSLTFVAEQLRQLQQLTVELADPRSHPQAGSKDFGVGALAGLSSSLCSLRLAAPAYWAWQRDTPAAPAVYAAAAAALQHLTRLTSLELANWELEQGTASLCQCARNLQHLAITGLVPRLTPAGAADLAAATAGSGLAALSSLVLLDCLPEAPAEAARALCALQQLLRPLRSLRLGGVGIAGECGPALARALTGSSRLKVLDVSSGARLFPGFTACLAGLTGIHRLSLSCCQPSSADMLVIAAALTGLTSIDISGNTWIQDGDAVLRQVGKLTRLRHLDCSRIGVVSAAGMAAAVRNLQLTSLVAAEVNRLTEQCIAELLVGGCKKLQLLDARPVAHIFVSAC